MQDTLHALARKIHQSAYRRPAKGILSSRDTPRTLVPTFKKQRKRKRASWNSNELPTPSKAVRRFSNHLVGAIVSTACARGNQRWGGEAKRCRAEVAPKIKSACRFSNGSDESPLCRTQIDQIAIRLSEVACVRSFDRVNATIPIAQGGHNQ